jgi:sortase A
VLATIAKKSREDIVRTRTIERVLLATGLMLLSVWFAAQFHRTISARTAIAEFEAENTSDPSNGASVPVDPVLGAAVDFHLWSAKRISAYEDSLARKGDAPLAILRIPKINLEVPVFDDTDDWTLNRGVGRILGTAQVGALGNLGIAGHRDGFFRGLQNMAAGDVLELVRPGHSDRYFVSEIRIVKPEDTWVLNPTAAPTLTLVTCFPFYFVGHAPNRYIVTGVLHGAYESGAPPTKTQLPRASTIKIRRGTNDLN